jgi:hypothetical protein
MYDYIDLLVETIESNKDPEFVEEITDFMKTYKLETIKEVASEAGNRIERSNEEVEEKFEDYDLEPDWAEVQDDVDRDLEDPFYDDDVDADTNESIFIKREVQKPNLWYAFQKAIDMNNKVDLATVGVSIDNVKPGIDTDREFIKFINYLTLLSEDITLLAGIAGINQGVKNKLPDLHNFLSKLKDYYIKNFKDVPEGMSTLGAAEHVLNNIKFKQDMDSSWTGAESVFNVISVIHSSPHIWSMLQTSLIAYKNMSAASVTNRFVIDVMERLPVKMEDTGSLNAASNDYNLAVILQKMKVSSPNNVLIDVFDSKKELSYKADISTPEGRENFIDWMEGEVIPNLKLGIVRNDLGNIDLDGTKPKIYKSMSQNLFISKLMMDQMLDRTGLDTYIYYKIPFDLVNIDDSSTDALVLLDALKTSFSDLRDKYYNGNDITELFAIYDFIINKDKSNSNSFKPLITAIQVDMSEETFLNTVKVISADLDLSDFKIDLDFSSLEALALRGYGVERKYVKNKPKEFDPMVIKVMKKDIENDIYRWHYFIKYDERYVPVSSKFSKKILSLNPSGSEMVIDRWEKGVSFKKTRLARYLDKNISINIKDC